MSTDPQTSVTVEPDAVEGVGAAPTATAGITLPLDVFSDVLFVVDFGGADGLVYTLRELAAEQGHPTEAVV